MENKAPLAEWVDRVFGRAIPGKFNRRRLTRLCGATKVTLTRLAEVFEKPSILDAYSDAVLNQAFWDLRQIDAFSCINDPAIAWPVRYRLIRSFEILFKDFFARRCAPVQSNMEEKGTPLNESCYMWFDNDCLRSPQYALAQTPYDAPLMQTM